jgi:hypothetical protein
MHVSLICIACSLHQYALPCGPFSCTLSQEHAPYSAQSDAALCKLINDQCLTRPVLLHPLVHARDQVSIRSLISARSSIRHQISHFALSPPPSSYWLELCSTFCLIYISPLSIVLTAKISCQFYLIRCILVFGILARVSFSLYRIA